jgi:hypothetical protein
MTRLVRDLITNRSSLALSISHKNLFTSLFFSVLLAIGLTQFTNYGISFDEPVSRDNGGISLRYIIEKFDLKIFIDDAELTKLNVPLKEYRDRDYGVVFDLPVFALERALQINSSREQYLLRHLLTFIVYWVGLISFFVLLVRSFASYSLGFVGVLMLFLSPRIFADSFYNNKDIVLMALGMMCSLSMFNFIRKTTFLNCAIHALFTALTIDTRIVGLIFAFTTLILFCYSKIKVEKKLNIFLFLSIYLFLLFIFVIIFWPWLWEAPIKNIYTAFINMANFRWPNYNLYTGDYVSALRLPWHYSLVWIGITTPPTYLFLALLGSLFLISKILVIRNNPIFTNSTLAAASALCITFGTLAPIALMNSTLYDGWRQLYFLYPSIIYLAIFGLDHLSQFLKKYGLALLRYSISVLIAIQFLITGLWMYSNHPFQNVYFNYLAPYNWSRHFEGDYWGVTNLHLLQFIAANDSRETIKVHGVGATGIIQSLSMLRTDSNAKKFIYVANINDADYLITNFRFLSSADRRVLAALPMPFYELIIDSNTIAAIYRH